MCISPEHRDSQRAEVGQGRAPPRHRQPATLAAHKTNSKLVAVVPLSTTEPKRPEPYHCQLRQSPVPDSRGAPVWAKCDMVAVVSTARLDLIRLHRRRADGRREYMTNRLDSEQFDDIRRGVAHTLGLGMIVLDPEKGLSRLGVTRAGPGTP